MGSTDRQGPRPDRLGLGMAKKKDNKKKAAAKATPDIKIIAENRKARHDYFIEEQFEAGLSLEGWEVKSLRAGRGNLAESYAVIRDGEIFLLGAHIAPLPSASTPSFQSPAGSW